MTFTVVAYDKDTYSGIVEVVEATDAQTAADQVEGSESDGVGPSTFVIAVFQGRRKNVLSS